jgi:hypothetical protein
MIENGSKFINTLSKHLQTSSILDRYDEKSEDDDDDDRDDISTEKKKKDKKKKHKTKKKGSKKKKKKNKGYASRAQDDLSDFRVAFLGDQGYGPDPVRVLKMVKNWGAELVCLLGDFDYLDDPGGILDNKKALRTIVLRF